MAKSVVGLFDTVAQADQAVQALLDSGIPREDISAVANDPGGSYDNAAAAGEPNVSEGAGVGAIGGTLVGGTFGLLAGLGVMVIPGIGPILAAGPLLAALGATALGAGVGAAAGGLIGALSGAGVPQTDAQLYAEGVRRGGTLLVVTIDDTRTSEVTALLQNHGVVDIHERGASWQGDQLPDPRVRQDEGEEVEHPRAPAGAAAGAVATGAAVGAVGGPAGAAMGALAGGVIGGITGAAADHSEERGGSLGDQDPDQMVDSDPRPDPGSAYRAAVDANEQADDNDDGDRSDAVRARSGHPEAAMTRSLDYDASVPSTRPPEENRPVGDHVTEQERETSHAAATAGGAGAAAGAVVGAALGTVGGPLGVVGGAAAGAAAGAGLGAGAGGAEDNEDLRSYGEVPPEAVYNEREQHENSEYLDESARSTWEESSKVGTGGGTLAGVVAGAAIGAAAGPVGAVIGGIAGAITGAGIGAVGDVIGRDSSHGPAGPHDYQGQLNPHDHPPQAHTHRADEGQGISAPHTPGGRVRVYDVPEHSWAGAHAHHHSEANTQHHSDAVHPSDAAEHAREDWRDSSKVGTAGSATGATLEAADGPVGGVGRNVTGTATGAGVGAAGDVAGEHAEGHDNDGERAVGAAGRNTDLRDEQDANTKGVTESEGRKGQVSPT
ncbi:MAG TPA: hypothetical protein VFS21_14790 [Roseiflexaceae bacterium]|nr:hypothetical protein [Roseiflexaceae bacterium]